VLQQFKGGFKLEKNCVIKLGRVRLRVRDMDNEPRSSYFNAVGGLFSQKHKLSQSARPKVSTDRIAHEERLSLGDI
jgi:hypothetical protein